MWEIRRHEVRHGQKSKVKWDAPQGMQVTKHRSMVYCATEVRFVYVFYGNRCKCIVGKAKKSTSVGMLESCICEFRICGEIHLWTSKFKRAELVRKKSGWTAQIEAGAPSSLIFRRHVMQAYFTCICITNAGGTLCESMRQLKELKSSTLQFD